VYHCSPELRRLALLNHPSCSDSPPGKERGREGGREGGRERGREGGREGGRVGGSGERV
jgi:hypothetical protein